MKKVFNLKTVLISTAMAFAFVGCNRAKRVGPFGFTVQEPRSPNSPLSGDMLPFSPDSQFTDLGSDTASGQISNNQAPPVASQAEFPSRRFSAPPETNVAELFFSAVEVLSTHTILSNRPVAGWAQELRVSRLNNCRNDNSLIPLRAERSRIETANSPFTKKVDLGGDFSALSYFGFESSKPSGSFSCGAGPTASPSTISSTGSTGAVRRGCGVRAYSLSNALKGCEFNSNPAWVSEYALPATDRPKWLKIPSGRNAQHDVCYLSYVGIEHNKKGVSSSCAVEWDPGHGWVIGTTGQGGTRSCRARCLSVSRFAVDPKGESDRYGIRALRLVFHRPNTTNAPMREMTPLRHHACFPNYVGFSGIGNGNASCYVADHGNFRFSVGSTGSGGNIARSCGSVCVSFAVPQ